MFTFKKFMEKSEEQEDIEKTLGKLPRSHRALVHGYNFKFHGGNTLAGDDQHIGYMDAGEKEIAVAAPWNYGREFALLHEVGHTVWERLDPKLQQQWAKIVKRTKEKQAQSPEELFCMAYSNFYSKNKITIHDHPEWNEFIKNLPH